jgi:hypothetical protein
VAVSIKSALGHITLDLYFCTWWDLQVMQCIVVRLGEETSTHYFSCSRGPGTDSIKSTLGRVTLKFFLHPVRSRGHIVHSSLFGT